MADSKKDFDAAEILNPSRIYPDATALFTSRLIPLKEEKGQCLVVLDTNTLLVPYMIGPKSLGEIEKTYSQLVKSGQLRIPGQVAREFAKHRATKLGELYQQLNRKKQIQNLAKGSYPLLESLTEYTEGLELEKQIDDLLGQYRAAVEKLMDRVRSWEWDDPVSVIYAKLFAQDVVFDPKFDLVKLAEDYQWRMRYRIPPGFKDDAPGDVVIWNTILELAKQAKRSVLFVSHDEKTDWYHQSEGQALYPRHELIDEFRRSSDGRSFHIMRFSAFLGLFGASDDAVQEVRKEEGQPTLTRRRRRRRRLSELDAIDGARQIAMMLWPDCVIGIEVGLVNFVVRTPTVKGQHGFIARIAADVGPGMLKSFTQQAHRMIDLGMYAQVVIVLVSRTEERHKMTQAMAQATSPPPDCSIIVAWMPDGKKVSDYDII